MSSAFLDALHADPWADVFVDLPSLNASASNAIEANIRRVREVARTEPQALRSNSLVVLGPPGAGKTHLFARLRRKLGPRAVFVHVRPLVHTEITPRFVLGEIVKQLGYATHGVSRLPQVHAMVGSLLAHLAGEDAFFPSAFLADCEAMSEEERESRLDAAIEQVLAIWQEVDESYLRRLLRVPFAKSPALQRAMLAWLSGRDCDVTQLTRIGATASLGEEVAVSALRTLSVVAALGAPIVVVFDQLENLVDTDGPGARLLAYANLTSELVDSMRGLVLVHMALDTEWSRGIEPALNLSQRSRLLMGQDTLALPTSRQREELLELWIAQLPERPAVFPWPFTEGQARRLCERPGVTPRMLLLEVRRAFHGEFVEDVDVAPAPIPAPTGASEHPRLAAEWEERVAAARNTADEASEQRVCLDPSRLADGLLSCGRFLERAQVGAVKGAEVGQLRLSWSSGSARLAILHQSHFKSLASALVKLTTLSARESVVVIRERIHDLLPSWKDAAAKRSGLLATGRARWVWLDREDAVSLLALDSLLQGARSGDVTDENGAPLSEQSVAEWVAANLNVEKWPIVRDLLASEAEDSVEQSSSPLRASEGQPASGMALGLLRRLRIASLDRVVREVMRVDPRATRASVIAELEGSPSDVRWFGRTILGVRVP